MHRDAFRHAKALGGWGSGAATLASLGYDGQPGVVTADSGEEVLTAVTSLLAQHPVWNRFLTMS